MPTNSTEKQQLLTALDDVADMPETTQVVEWIAAIYDEIQEKSSSKGAIDLMEKAAHALGDNAVLYGLTDAQDAEQETWEVCFALMMRLRHHTLSVRVYINKEISTSRIETCAVGFLTQKERDELFEHQEVGQEMFEKCRQYVTTLALLLKLEQTAGKESG